MTAIENTLWLRAAETRIKAGVPLICEVCGKEFVGHSLTSRYCSSHCRLEAVALRRQAERLAKRTGE